MPRPLSKHSKAYPRKGNDRPKTTSVRSSSRAETRRAERNDKILPPVNKSEVRAHHSKMIAQFQAMLRPIRKPKRGVPTIASPEPLENYFYFNACKNTCLTGFIILVSLNAKCLKILTGKILLLYKLTIPLVPKYSGIAVL